MVQDQRKGGEDFGSSTVISLSLQSAEYLGTEALFPDIAGAKAPEEKGLRIG